MTRLLVTGALGHVGRALLRELTGSTLEVVATDIAGQAEVPGGFRYEPMDVRAGDVERVIASVRPDCVIHLASIVSPPKGADRAFAREVDVTGTRNVIDACIRHDVKRLVVTSSGAAYGYHRENCKPLTEDDPIRGNEAFAYSHHKRLCEEMLAEARAGNPELEQVILRVGTVLGNGLENQITALFHKPRLLGVTGSESPFVFIWDEDLAKILRHAAIDGPPGIFNVAGDGALGISDFSSILGKPVFALPAWVLKLALFVAKPLGLSQYGPEQVRFLQFRPVLDNTRLKTEFGYTPEKSSHEAFEAWRSQAGL